MRIYRAENFRYRKSAYSKVMVVLTILLSAGVYFVLKYVSGNANPDLLEALSFDEQSVETLRGNMYGVRYVFASLSGIDILMMLTGIVIALHVSSDYGKKTIRYEQMGTERHVVYLKRLLSACTFGICITLIYMFTSFAISLIFLREKITGEELGIALMLAAEELILVCGFTAFIYMIFTFIKNQIVSVVTIILLITLISPGLKFICESVGLDIICDRFFIATIMSNVSVFPQSVKDAASYMLTGLLYFVFSYLAGAAAYDRQKL